MQHDPSRASPPGPSASRRRDLHSWFAAAAGVFVLLALAALAASPLLTFRRLAALQRMSAATTVAADSDLIQERLLFAEEVVQGQARRAGDSLAAARYAAARARDDALLGHLTRLAPQMGGAVPHHVAVLRRRVAAWHALVDTRSAAPASDSARVAWRETVRPLRESVLVAHARLVDEVRRVDAHAHALGAEAVDEQRDLSVILGLFAAVAAVVVAGFIRRERRLTAALARAVDEEQRFRALAEQQREEVLRVGESRARLVRGFTHDVRNPIGAAGGFLALLDAGLPEPPTDGQREMITRARRSLDAALHLIGDLLDVARAEAGAVEVRPAPTDLAAVARDAAEEYRAQAESKGLELRVAVADAGPTLTTDPVRVRQVLGNLISNAVKYTDRGRVTVRVLDAHPGRDADGAARYAVEVVDTGRGIAPEHQARLFEEFVRLAPDVAPGVGLGLAISRRIAQALGGDLDVRSAPGRGSTFVLWLPGPEAAPAPAAARLSRPESARPLAGR